jgi:hypothetical protein
MKAGRGLRFFGFGSTKIPLRTELKTDECDVRLRTKDGLLGVGEFGVAAVVIRFTFLSAVAKQRCLGYKRHCRRKPLMPIK